MSLDIAIRPATKADVSDIALLFNIAAHGLPAQGWYRDPAAAGTYSPIEVGRMMLLRDGRWQRATMAEVDGEVVGMLLGLREPDEAEPTPAEAPPHFVPLYELEAEAAGSWYITMLAVHAAWRNKGIGTRLLELADEKRAETAARGLSLIVEDVNEGARRLYERRGFAVRDSRPMVKFPGGGPNGEDWLLMVKD